MIPPLFSYQLAVLGLLWLCILLHPVGPNRGAVSPQRPVDPEPIPPQRQRAHKPKPFVGLTHNPPCALCEHEATHGTPPSPMRPEPLPPTHRRPRTVDTSRHFCPHTECDYRGWLGLNNLRAHGHPSGGPWRQFHCTACDGYFPEHHGTIFHGKQAAVELIVRVLACLAEGLGIRATARVFEVAPNTVLQWLVEAAEQLRAFAAYFLCEVHVKQLQLDELYAVLSAVKEGEISEAKAIQRLSRSPHGVWVALDVGERTRAMAQRFVHHVTQVLAPDCVPLFVTDGFREYLTALLHPLWAVGAATSTASQRAAAQAALDAPTTVALCAGGQDHAASARGRRHALRGLRHARGRQAGAGAAGLADQHVVCGACEPQYPPPCGGHRSPGEYAMQRGGGLTAAAGAVPRLRQFLPPSCEFAPAPVGSRSHQWPWLGQGVAAVHAGDGGWMNGSRLVVERSVALPGATVATAASGVSGSGAGGS
jgi:hypothetical protein